MNKFLDIILIVIITFLIINVFNSFNKKEIKTGLNISFSEKNYTTPASIKVNISNFTESMVSLNTCNDLNILHSGEKIEFNSKFCKDLKIKSGEIKEINYSREYKKFMNFGEYTLKGNIGKKEYVSQFNLESRGSISKVFITLIYAPIYNLVIGLIILFGNSFGWAIIGVTILIRLALIYPQHKMMVSQRKLQAIQPKIKEIQKKYKNNKQELGMKIMDLYKKEKVNPIGSCGFLIIQAPILIVIYRIIIGIQDPVNIYYLYSGISNFDISSINFNFLGMNLLEVGGIQGLILAIVVSLIQMLQIKLSLSRNKKQNSKDEVVLEKKKGKDDYNSMMPDPEIMNKFMLFGMPIMVGVFTYTLFAGIGIYWGIGTIFMIIQQIIVNKIVKNSN